MAKTYISNDGDWPKPCPGGCGRVMRAPHHRSNQFPGRTTRAAVNNTGICHTCAGLSRRFVPLRPAETEEAKLRRMRADLDALVADRRRRGVPPEGTPMPGEQPDYPDRQRALPVRDDQYTDPEAPLGYCGRGHPFTGRDSAGRRWCKVCNDAKNIRSKERMEQRTAAKRGIAVAADRKPSPEAPHGRCMLGHPYTGVNGVKKKQKYCATCKKMGAVARHTLMARRAQREAA